LYFKEREHERERERERKKQRDTNRSPENAAKKQLRETRRKVECTSNYWRSTDPQMRPSKLREEIKSEMYDY